jgi:hypothetical protein
MKNRINDMSINPDEQKVKSPEVTKATKAQKVTTERKDPSRRPSHHKGHPRANRWVCVKKGDVVVKAERATVEAKYISAGWNYCPRKDWRAYIAANSTAPTPTSKKSKKVQEA